MKRIAFILVIVFIALTATAQHAASFIRGIVRDSVSMQGLPYASITLIPGGKSTLADGNGLFEINLPEGTTGISASCMGYATKVVPVKRTSHNLYDINLQAEAKELKEVVIKKKKYSKKNNPAVEFARRIRNSRHANDPRRNDFYTYDKYERIALGLNNFDTTRQNGMVRSMPFLLEHVDTSEIDGRPVLSLSLKETASTIYWKKEGSTEKTLIRGTRSNGIDEFIDEENVQAILTELLREVDLYKGDIMLLRNTFVSPLSAIAPDFYRFYLVDSAAIVPGSKEPHIALAFYPRNKASFGFSGHVYVPAADTSMFISRVEMYTPKDINLNYIRQLNITQTYRKAADGSRLKMNDEMLMVFGTLPKMPELYVSRKLHFDHHSFERPSESDSIFGQLGTTLTEALAAERDSVFWENERRVPEATGESRVDLLMERLRQRPLFYWSEKILKILVSGYIPTAKESKFDYGPVNTTASYNSLEGLRLRTGGMTTANLSKHWFGRGYVAYGFRDEKWKYSAEAEYSFNEKKYHPREFPVHSLKLMHRYDIDRLGTHYLYTNADNFVLSLARSSDNRFSYRRETKLTYTLELNNHFSLTATVGHDRQEATPFLPFITGKGEQLSHFDESSLSVSLRYAPGERFYQAKSYRIPINEDAPEFILSHTFAPTGVLGSKYTVNRTEFSFTKLFRLSILGQLSTVVGAGHVWGTAPFTELLIPNANLSYTIQPGSFALMNPMEFINSSYVSLHASWNLRGALFNLIPGFRKLGLREVVSFSGLYGRLSARNRPTATSNLLQFPEHSAMSNMSKPYMEVSAGLDNIFTVLRVDYVWRLNYLDVPYAIDRHGLRVAMHFTF